MSEMHFFEGDLLPSKISLKKLFKIKINDFLSLIIKKNKLDFYGNNITILLNIQIQYVL